MTDALVPTPAGNRDVAEVGSDLQTALARFMGMTVAEWQRLLADASKQYETARWKPEADQAHLKELLEFTRLNVDAMARLANEGPGKMDHLTPADLSWYDVMAVWGQDDDAGKALWEKIKQTARDELAVGKAGAVTIEGYNERPMKRAEFLAVWVALADGLKPANGAERLLIDGMAQALMMHRHWLHRMVQTDSLDEGRLQRAAAGRDRYEPPRLTEAEAVDRAALMADRFQRQFLRLMKCFRDGRRLIASLTVHGGQVNVAEQQVNVTGAAPSWDQSREEVGDGQTHNRRT